MPKELSLDVNNIKKLYQAGLSSRRVGELVGCASATVLCRLREIGSPPRKPNEWHAVHIPPSMLKTLYEDKQLTSKEVAQKLGCCKKVVEKRLRELGCTRNRGQRNDVAIARGRRMVSPNYLGKNKRLSSEGYIYIRQPGNPMAGRWGYVAEHRLVWEQYHNKPLPEGYVVHHINGIKTDNRPRNLLALPKRGHSSKMLLLEAQKKLREIEIENQQLRKALESQQMTFYVGDN